VSTNKKLAPYLIFELSQGAYACLNAKERAIMKALRQLGCRFSVDNITDPHFNRGLLAELGVGFLKLSSERLKAFMGTDVSVSVMQRIKQQLEKDKIAIIAERIEDEAVLREILDLELDYGQGFVFGQPEPFLDYFDKHEKVA
ncbi:MAG: EAL domain-containing protein, partial [Pseudobdellovibrionaceae bacterium]